MGALDLIAKAAKAVKKSGPFFSKADEVLEELQRGKGTGDEFLTEMVKKGAKPTELKERGIEKALKGKPKMTKAEVKKVFEEKAPPKIKEEVRGGNEYKEALDEKAREIIGDEYATFDDLYGRDREAARSAVERDFGYEAETQYEKWRTPGGENYREILLKLPQRGLNDAEKRILMNYEADVRRGAQLDPWHQSQYDALKAKEAMGSQDYMSPHFEGTPNILAHIRVQDFKTPEGKKVLLVDEIQSDWHQAGRKSGYRSGAEQEQINALADEYNNLTLRRRNLIREAEELNNAGPAFLGMMDEIGEITPKLTQLEQQMDVLRKSIDEGVPDAPFKKNWHELAMKRVLDYAAENGYDTVAITPGAEQAKRYDLSKQVQQIMAAKEDGGVRIFARDNQGKNHDMGVHAPEALDAVIGKDLAQKVAAQTKPTDIYEGVDLQIGGEGMKGFYDKILPDYLNTYGKQYGAGVGQIDLITKPEKSIPQIAAPGLGHFPEPTIEPAQTLKAHRFDITPQMREQIQTKGQPFYSKIGMGPEGLAAGTGAATIGAQPTAGKDEQPVQNPVHFTENPDAMLLELMQRN